MTPAGWKQRLAAHWPLWVFVALLATHAFLTTRNWQSGFLVGHEFRQTQTGLSALFIQRDHDFSLAYPTPVFGKPWSIPMEFPLYQWLVALLAEATGWPIAVAGRTVSLAAFYATLPALWLLLAELGVARRARWFALAVVVCTPVHLFYARAVLIETLALAGGVWHLAAFCRWMRTGGRGWLALAALAGTVAALVKVTTAMIWLSLSAVAALWHLARAWPERTALGRTALRAVAAVVLPLAAGAAWVRYADHVKSLSPGGSFLRSESLAGFNFGHLADRTSPAELRNLAETVGHALGAPWLALALAVVAVWCVRRSAWPVVAGLLAAVATVFTFPALYRIHDYYFVAMACLPAAAAGLALGLLEAHRPTRWLAIIALGALVGLQLHSYSVDYAPLQRTISNGGSGLTNVLRNATPRDGVLVIAGDDWSSTLPYYSERRALMLTGDRVDDAAYLDLAFANLRGEPIAALVLKRAQRQNQRLLARAHERLGVRPEPIFSDADHDVYAPPEQHDAFYRHLDRYRIYSGVRIRGMPTAVAEAPANLPLTTDNQPHLLSEAQAREHFSPISPLPFRYACKFGFGLNYLNDQPVLGAHPDSALWIRLPEGATTVEAGFGLPRRTHEDGDERTDGVHFEIAWIKPDGTEQILWQRDLQPAERAEDRDTQKLTLTLPPGAAGELVARTGPRGNYTRDWAYWTGIHVR